MIVKQVEKQEIKYQSFRLLNSEIGNDQNSSYTLTIF